MESWNKRNWSNGAEDLKYAVEKIKRLESQVVALQKQNNALNEKYAASLKRVRELGVALKRKMAIVEHLRKEFQYSLNIDEQYNLHEL